MTTSTYPVKVNAQMDVRLNRSLWLVRAIPELQELTVARRSPFSRQLCMPKRGDRANIAIAATVRASIQIVINSFVSHPPKYETLIILSKFKEFSAAICRASNA
jgi:hypothetical protein